MHLFPLLNKSSDHGLRKGYLFLIKSWDKNIWTSGHGLRKGYLFLTKTSNSQITGKEKVTFPDPRTGKSIFRNTFPNRDINQHPARFSNLINQKQITDPNQSVHADSIKSRDNALRIMTRTPKYRIQVKIQVKRIGTSLIHRI